MLEKSEVLKNVWSCTRWVAVVTIVACQFLLMLVDPGGSYTIVVTNLTWHDESTFNWKLCGVLNGANVMEVDVEMSEGRF